MGQQDGSSQPPKAVTEFTPEEPINPTQPDFVSEGKIIDAFAIIGGASKTSKTVQFVSRVGCYTKKAIYVTAPTGTFDVEVILDESERATGAPVWRKIATSQAVTAGTLASYIADLLVRQVRIVYTNGGTGGVVNAWFFSV